MNTAKPDPLVRYYHACCALNLCEAQITTLINTGRLPTPDVKQGVTKMWKLSTLRRANPDLADSIELLLKIPRTAAA